MTRAPMRKSRCLGSRYTIPFFLGDDFFHLGLEKPILLSSICHGFCGFSYGLRRNGLGLSSSLRRFPCVPRSCKPHPMETSEPYRPLLMKFQPPITYRFHCSAFASRLHSAESGGASVLPEPWKRVLGLAYQDARSISNLVFPHLGTCWKDRVLNS
jgi:hypothetical protein